MVLMNLFAGKEKKCRCRDKLMDIGWEGEGEGGMKVESNMETYILPYVKKISSVAQSCTILCDPMDSQ